MNKKKRKEILKALIERIHIQKAPKTIKYNINDPSLYWIRTTANQTKNEKETFERSEYLKYLRSSYMKEKSKTQQSLKFLESIKQNSNEFNNMKSEISSKSRPGCISQSIIRNIATCKNNKKKIIIKFPSKKENAHRKNNVFKLSEVPINENITLPKIPSNKIPLTYYKDTVI